MLTGSNITLITIGGHKYKDKLVKVKNFYIIYNIFTHTPDTLQTLIYPYPYPLEPLPLRRVKGLEGKGKGTKKYPRVTPVIHYSWSWKVTRIGWPGWPLTNSGYFLWPWVHPKDTGCKMACPQWGSVCWISAFAWVEAIGRGVGLSQ